MRRAGHTILDSCGRRWATELRARAAGAALLGAAPLAILLLLVGCHADEHTGVVAGDAGHGPRDLSALFPEEDLAGAPDLAPEPVVFHCPPSCDGGACQVRCRSDGGALPDLVVPGMMAEWQGAQREGRFMLTACVLNQGEGDAPAGTPVTFRWNGELPVGGPEVVATVRLAEPLAAGQGVEVHYLWVNPPMMEGNCRAWAVAGDDGAEPPRIPRGSECNVDNNASERVDTHLCGVG